MGSFFLEISPMKRNLVVKVYWLEFFDLPPNRYIIDIAQKPVPCEFREGSSRLEDQSKSTVDSPKNKNGVGMER